MIILLAFVAGLGAGVGWPEEWAFDAAASTSIVLYLLIFLAGTSVGGDARVWQLLRSVRPHLLFLPLGVALGSLAGAAAVSFLLPLTLRDALAVGAGLGYYSLSSLLITELRGEMLGTIALLSNILRELLTFVLAPLLVRFGGKLGPIASGGATVMDTTLPVVLAYSGKDLVVMGFVSAICLTFAVPLLIAIIL